jgi:hypothetical protein
MVRGETPQSFGFQGDSNPGEAIVHRFRELSIKMVFLRNNFDSLVKNPSAALRFNPAPLDLS